MAMQHWKKACDWLIKSNLERWLVSLLESRSMLIVEDKDKF